MVLGRIHALALVHPYGIRTFPSGVLHLVSHVATHSGPPDHGFFIHPLDDLGPQHLGGSRHMIKARAYSDQALLE